MNRPITNVVFKGADFSIHLDNYTKIIEETDFIKVYTECFLYMGGVNEGVIDYNKQCFREMLKDTIEIGFSDGTTEGYFPYFKDLKHIYTDDLEINLDKDKYLKFKVMAVFRNKE